MLSCKVFLIHEVFKLEFGAEPNNNNNKSLTSMLKIYVATTTETMLVSNLPCWKFENKRSNANGMYAECT